MNNIAFKKNLNDFLKLCEQQNSEVLNQGNLEGAVQYAKWVGFKEAPVQEDKLLSGLYHFCMECISRRKVTTQMS